MDTGCLTPADDCPFGPAASTGSVPAVPAETAVPTAVPSPSIGFAACNEIWISFSRPFGRPSGPSVVTTGQRDANRGKPRALRTPCHSCFMDTPVAEPTQDARSIPSSYVHDSRLVQRQCRGICVYDNMARRHERRLEGASSEARRTTSRWSRARACNGFHASSAVTRSIPISRRRS